jgi:alkaline phosphatase
MKLRQVSATLAAVMALGMTFSTPAFAKKKPGNMTPQEIVESGNFKNLRKAKNIIFMVPDGMGLAYVTAARIYKNGPDGAPLSFETLDEIGYQRTHSKNSTVTDSAAAAGAWACGQKFNNGEISFNGDTEQPVETILEIAKEKGKATGLVATSTITHATPAAFGSHVIIRKCESEIARQYIQEKEWDVILGGGIDKFTSNVDTHVLCDDTPFNDLTVEAAGKGYDVVYTADEMNNAVADGSTKLLGLFAPGGLTPEVDRLPGTTEPHLYEMTEAALDILEDEKQGFFLVVEGSQIDWAGHDNDVEYQIGETLAFDAAVEAVKEWIAADKKRQKQTLLIVVPDHETGGFMINGPYGDLSEAGDIVEDGWTSGGHTAVDTLVWSSGPKSSLLGKAMDNTDLFWVMQAVMN